MDWIAAFFCDEGPFQGICENIVFVLAGFDEAQTNQTLLETIIHHTPAGASTNTLLHFAQEINSSNDSTKNQVAAFLPLSLGGKNWYPK